MNAGINHIGVGCGAIIINENDEVLLVKRSAQSRTEPEYWSRPGGEVDFGEAVEDAVVREVKEETSINVEILKFLEITQVLDDKKHWIALGYLARYLSGEVQNLEPEKHDAIKWFPLSQLPDKITSYTRNAITVHLQSK
ncbi:NUDIX domain-containing protein [Candidatus Woesearchaeota archaeon]|nr:NUDIX domain-containing protein [Candidatus Woesearchaeota archaeon]